MYRIPTRRLYALAMIALPVMVPASAPWRQAIAAAPVAADESAVSTGSWFCGRYSEAVAASRSDAASEVVSAVRSFALGYVYGVSDAVGKPLPGTAAIDRRIVERLDSGCSADPARAVRDATLLAGRAMLEDAQSVSGNAAPGATGSLACNAHLDAAAPAEPSSRPAQVHNWADGYINARFERAGRGMIPTARNKALMLERFAAACAAMPSATVREAARSVADAALPAR